MRTPILVLGGAGYVGSHACKALSEAGFLPVSYDNLSSGHRWAVQWGPLEIGDIADEARLTAAFRQHRPAAVMHFASYIEAGESVVDPARFYHNNVVNMLAVLQAMRRARVEKIVFSSSAAVFGEARTVPITESHPIAPTSPYGATKSMCERILSDFAAAYRVRAVSLRYFNAAGADPAGQIGEAHQPETHLIPLVLEAAAGMRPHISVFGQDYKTSDGTCVRDYVHVSDLASAHVLALHHLDASDGAHAFNLGNGRGYTVREVISASERTTERTIPVKIENARAGDPASLVADSSLARAKLGWRPANGDLQTQIEHAWRWFQRYRAATHRAEAARSAVLPFPERKRFAAERLARDSSPAS